MAKKKYKDKAIYDNFVETANSEYRHLFDRLPDDIDFSDDDAMKERFGLTQQELLDVFNAFKNEKIIWLVHKTIDPETGEIDPYGVRPGYYFLSKTGYAYYEPEEDMGFYGVRLIFMGEIPMLFFSEPAAPYTSFTGIMQHRFPMKFFKIQWTITKYVRESFIDAARTTDLYVTYSPFIEKHETSE